ncbi:MULTISPECIES: hypothetical protein [Sorangium]|uniref:Secreted protein n=1 Tax=Sorangium cellulosum (strain So ce56) TaxID=448385 RepID=A9GEN9_SORC5|nr:hypothetical protein [Sorangium cellulosum]CAN93037.1 putative secreted protein [Sorangium cellulosum So ce56]
MMENDMGRCCSALACVVGLLASPAAWAQDPAPPPADPGAAAAAAPAPVAEPAAPAPIPSWFRFDADSLGLQLWAGATHQVGPISLSSDIYLTTLGTAEFDIGPAFTMGPVTLNPMVGFSFNFMTMEPAALVAPQLFTFVDAKPVYFESWILGSFSSMFNESVQNYVYTRDFLLYYPIDDFGIGPHLEATVDLNEVVTSVDDPLTAGVDEGSVDESGFASLQVGGVIGLNYGTGNKLLLYLGYETQEESQAGGNKLAGRFTFVHNF